MKLILERRTPVNKSAVLGSANESLYAIPVTKTWLVYIGIDDLRSAVLTQISRIDTC